MVVEVVVVAVKMMEAMTMGTAVRLNECEEMPQVSLGDWDNYVADSQKQTSIWSKVPAQQDYRWFW